MKSHLVWLDALLNLPRLLRRWWYVRKLPPSQLRKLIGLKEGQEQPMIPLILDVRSREEFSGELGHLERAVLLREATRFAAGVQKNFPETRHPISAYGHGPGTQTQGPASLRGRPLCLGAVNGCRARRVI